MDVGIVIELFEKVGIPVLTAAAAGYGLWWLIRWITNTFRQDVLTALKNLHKELDEEIRDTRELSDKKLAELTVMVVRLIDRVRILEKNFIEHDETLSHEHLLIRVELLLHGHVLLLVIHPSMQQL